ncbi:hypothetical protein ACFSKU_07265 [Pontibacter silvestris]|uniref:Addiction module component n=1 Tax=Pontibacter silvestris TaxID=2305183 RepID=A0ABW4WXE6_9BACT|nr:hypothetical protein [Pontibacter silvestris]MCC9136590.1 hypothetical protein [Pontibacter silvestris]
MRPALEEIKHLEAFLQGRLPEEEELDVEIRLLWDQEWKQQVTQQQLSYQAIREAGRQQLRQELQAVHQRLFG